MTTIPTVKSMYCVLVGVAYSVVHGVLVGVANSVVHGVCWWVWLTPSCMVCVGGCGLLRRAWCVLVGVAYSIVHGVC